MYRSDNFKTNHLEKHWHRKASFADKNTETLKIVLVGNPNVGKSLIFNELSGLNAEVSNYPGTTVEITKGYFGKYELYDTPGIYSVSSFSDEERVARDIIMNADIIVNVVDATHLERDLFLTQQLIDMGKKIVVLLNFMDEVEKYDIEIDIDALSKLIGLNVYPIIAINRIGFENLPLALERAGEGIQTDELHSELHLNLNVVGSQAEALLVLEGDIYVSEQHGVKPGNQREEIYINRRNRVNFMVNRVVLDRNKKIRFAELFGRWALRPASGIPILILVLYGSYLFIGKLVAQDLINFTENHIGKNLWEPWIRSATLSFFSESTWMYTILAGEFGIITMTTTYLIFLLLPLVASFYIVLALMEDSGYLPRLATMVDRFLNFLGLNGKAVIPLILGFGCVTSATITTRILNTDREKTIATTILQFAIPCSAQLAVIAALLAKAGFIPMLFYSLVILAVLIAIGAVLNKILKGEPTSLLLDLPPIRLPKFVNIARKTIFRTYIFMKEASVWFFVGAFFVGLAQMTGLLNTLQSMLNPITTEWLQLPSGAAMVFIMGVVRRDFGAAGLYHMSLTPMQITVALLTITLFVPCIASLIVMMKERGMKEGFLIWLGTWIVAFTVGGVVSQILV